MIKRDFPAVGKFQQKLNKKRSKKLKKSTEIPAGPSSVGSICCATTHDGGICDCPQRIAAPADPKELPFPSTLKAMTTCEALFSNDMRALHSAHVHINSCHASMVCL